MAAKSRRKGKVGERECAALLREHGFDARRGVQYQGGADSPDVVGLPGWHIEVKRANTFNAYKALEQAISEKATLDAPVVFHRADSRQWIVVLNADAFLELVKAAR